MPLSSPASSRSVPVLSRAAPALSASSPEGDRARSPDYIPLIVSLSSFRPDGEAAL